MERVEKVKITKQRFLAMVHTIMAAQNGTRQEFDKEMTELLKLFCPVEYVEEFEQ